MYVAPLCLRHALNYIFMCMYSLWTNLYLIVPVHVSFLLRRCYTSPLLFSVTLIVSIPLNSFSFHCTCFFSFFSLSFLTMFLAVSLPPGVSSSFTFISVRVFLSTSFLSSVSRCLLFFLSPSLSHKLLLFCVELLLHIFLFSVLQNILLQSYLLRGIFPAYSLVCLFLS